MKMETEKPSESDIVPVKHSAGKEQEFDCVSPVFKNSSPHTKNRIGGKWIRKRFSKVPAYTNLKIY